MHHRIILLILWVWATSFSITSCSVLPEWQSILSDSNNNGSTVLDLQQNPWILSSLDPDGSIPYANLSVHIPGDLLSDLKHAGVVGDPYMDRSFLTQRHVWTGEKRSVDGDLHETVTRSRSWIYTTTFELPSTNGGALTWLLVLEGIKMGAVVRVNGKAVATVTDQFLRTIVPIPLAQSSSRHQRQRQYTLSITFDPTIPVDGRFAACSGGWDWAPYVHVADAQGKRSSTLGISAPIYIVPVQRYTITHVVPKVYYRGVYPTQLMKRPQAPFDVNVDVHLKSWGSSSPSPDQNCMVIVQVSKETEIFNQTIPIPEGDTGDIILTARFVFYPEDVELWWPNGMGPQPLYDVHAGLDCVDSDHSLDIPMIRKRIGFRVSALVTTNDTDPSSSNQTDGSGSHGMYLRVNGALVLARGANVIPMDQLEGRLVADAHRHLVESAAEANMNMLRIWGGGMILPEAFYRRCDELGVLLYHDMMFVDEAGHRPVKTAIVEQEIRHIVRSLASHTSIVVWNGCNECQVVMGTPTEIYAKFVMRVVTEEDDTRSIWPSSPSKHGWRSGVHTSNSLPNGLPLTTWDPNSFPKNLESHGPYMRSFSRTFPGVNGMDVGFPYDNLPPKLSPVSTGCEYPNTFISEFGSSVMSSFESMVETLSPKNWGLHASGRPNNCTHGFGNENICVGDNVLAERNYPCDTHILAYFGNASSLDLNGKEAFQAQLYHCMMAQALWMKGEIEERRATNSYGILVWQLNENWPTGGWGCVEYDSKLNGGRWKPLMYLLESSLFRDVFAACGVDNKCYVRNDGQESVELLLTFEAWRLGDILLSGKETHVVNLEAGKICKCNNLRHVPQMLSNLTIFLQIG
eukprot:Nitzschia sp. Nitz4//scaffold123_size70294//55400//58169//NITZ4_005933-RA/size70294-augustus-gene-0.65-mRNA-1//-1//CDS//3329534500//1125//frame0